MTELLRGAPRRGVVTAFDERVGLGVVSTRPGSKPGSGSGSDFSFHCIEIADGSRSIEVGSEVSFDVLAKLGRWEAANIRP